MSRRPRPMPGNDAFAFRDIQLGPPMQSPRNPSVGFLFCRVTLVRAAPNRGHRRGRPGHRRRIGRSRPGAATRATRRSSPDSPWGTPARSLRSRYSVFHRAAEVPAWRISTIHFGQLADGMIVDGRLQQPAKDFNEIVAWLRREQHHGGAQIPGQVGQNGIGRVSDDHRHRVRE